MKKFSLALLLSLSGFVLHAQFNASLAIQFYLDANNNCSYDGGEQLIYSAPATIGFPSASGVTGYNSAWFDTSSACNISTIYLSNALTVTPVSNTVFIQPGAGLALNSSCSSVYNLPYNSNALSYVPVSLTGTALVGASLQWMSFANNNGGPYNSYNPNNSVLTACSNLGNNTVSMDIKIHNYTGCPFTGSTSARTYSLYMDGLNYEVITSTTALGGSGNATQGTNGTTWLTEYYAAGTSLLFLNTQFPTTFTVLGTHTFEIRSTPIYNNPQTAISFVRVFNSTPCSKISGNFYTDCDANCSLSAGDGYNLQSFVGGKVYNTAAGLDIEFLPGVSGDFEIYVPSAMSCSLTQYPMPGYAAAGVTACTIGTTSIPAGQNTSSLSFGYQIAPGNYIDPLVYFYRASSSSTLMSPGVTAVFAVSPANPLYCGISQAINPGRVKVVLPDEITYVSPVAGPAPTVIPGPGSDTLIWNVPDFSVVSNTTVLSFSVVVSATAVPGSTVGLLAQILPTADNNVFNNVVHWTRTIGGPFDPNGKWVEAAGQQSNGDVPFGTNTFYYTVGFQNIGNAPAINVVTIDTIDTAFDLSSLRVLQSSYPVSLQVDNASRQAGFHFKGINLPGVATDEVGSHGFFRYMVKLKPGVSVNTVIKNRAYNYFDFNAPVATNQTRNTLVQSTGLADNSSQGLMLSAVPNPFRSGLTIRADRKLTIIQVYNLSGMLLMQQAASAAEVNLQLGELAPSLYLVRVQDAEGHVASLKVVKE